MSPAAAPAVASTDEARAESPLAHVAHRPWPLPRRPWALAMRWCDLAFLHRPIRPERLRPHLPPGLAVDTWDGWAWVGVVPFVMRDVRWRGLPALPGARDFPELNLRTYVRAGDGTADGTADGAPDAPGARAGVWFFSLDCASPLAVRGARAGFGLPYFDARITATRAGGDAGDAGGDWTDYASRRTHRGAPPATFRARYRATGAPRAPEPGSFEHWLVERYCLFARPPLRGLRMGEVHHPPWPLAPAECEVVEDTLAAAAGLALDARAPVVHHAAEVAVRAWLPSRLPNGRP